jgi:hypothetical protein
LEAFVAGFGASGRAVPRGQAMGWGTCGAGYFAVSTLAILRTLASMETSRNKNTMKMKYAKAPAATQSASEMVNCRRKWACLADSS